MTRAAAPSGLWRIIGRVGLGLGFAAVVVVLIVWLAGGFHRKIAAEPGAAEPIAGRVIADEPLVAARVIRVPATEAAVGTVRAVHEIAVASKLLARVRAVPIQAGQPVEKDQLLAELADEDLRARLQQAEAAVLAAQAARDQARIEFDRIERLHQQQQAAAIEFDRAANTLKAAEAELTRAQQVRNEAETILGYATIRSPIAGVIVDKRVEAGDTVAPGQVLLTLYDPTRMQLVASVRESLTRRLEVGQTIDVEIDALELRCAGRISEIVPEAESASRTFSVKVTGPCPPGVYSGMFGRLLIPLDETEVLVVPHDAVRRIGQLSIVDVADSAGAQAVLRRRAVQLGRSYGGDVEVLAGLRPGERVALAARRSVE